MDDTEIPFFMSRYPPPDMTPRQLEDFIGEAFRSVTDLVQGLEVQVRDRLTGSDGIYEIDATVRYRWAGLDFLVLVEAKLHRAPIKRETVQVLHAKVQSLAAHKGVLITTSRFQKGALDYAKAHGLGLVALSDGRFTIETRSAVPAAEPGQPKRWFEAPDFVGHSYGPGAEPGSTSSSLISPEYPEGIAVLLGVPGRSTPA